MPRLKHRHTHAFSYVEVMIVVLIMGILGSVAAPALEGVHADFRLDAASRAIVAALRYAQSQSIESGQAYGVEIDAAQNTFRCYLHDGATNPTVTNPFDKRSYQFDCDTYPRFAGVGIASASFGGGTFVTFDSLGAPSTGGTAVLSFGQCTRTITVNPVTGRVVSS